ncbi:TPA: hypothetical protein QCN73_005859 [Bacillus wiedmannii]|nr:hypothetical protein [Bacillus wiedmannii]
MTRIETEEDLRKPKIKFEITIDGVINVEDQIEVQNLYDLLVAYAKKHGGMNVTKNSGELYTMKAIEEGTLKTHTIAPVNVTLDEKNISLLAEEVYKRINSNLKTGALVRPF